MKPSKLFFLAVPLLLCACPWGPQPDQRKIAVAWPPGYAYVPVCKPMVKYQGTNFEIQGVTVPVPALGGPAEIGGVKMDPKVLNQAYQTTQTLDTYFRATCPYLASYSGNKEKFEQTVADMLAAQTKLAQLALSLQTSQQPAASSAAQPANTAASKPAASPAPQPTAKAKKVRLASWVASYSKKSKAAIVKTPAKPNTALGLPPSEPTPAPLPQ
jgi:hypothetical protein